MSGIPAPTSSNFLAFEATARGFKVSIDKKLKSNQIKDLAIELDFQISKELKGIENLDENIRRWFMDEFEKNWRKTFVKKFSRWIDTANRDLEGICEIARAFVRSAKQDRAVIKGSEEKYKEKIKEVKAKVSRDKNRVEKKLKEAFETVSRETTEQAFKDAKKGYRPGKTMKVESSTFKNWQYKVKIASMALSVFVVVGGIMVLAGAPIAATAATAATAVTATYLGAKFLSTAASAFKMGLDKYGQYRTATQVLYERITKISKLIEGCKTDLGSAYTIHMGLKDQLKKAEEQLKRAKSASRQRQDGRKGPKIEKLEKEVEENKKALETFNQAFVLNRDEMLDSLNAALNAIKKVEASIKPANLSKTQTVLGGLKDFFDSVEVFTG